MKLLKTLVLFVLLMASTMAAREGMYGDDRATLPHHGLLETSMAGTGTEAKTNGWPETGIHFSTPMPKPNNPKKP
ncbi:hypothetical protein IHE45_02G043800 [Dioscorea alata]|uniref:Uncharacterized protein n=1 Tax=Dioscorea alata TaxID=55571 RepID=A0ACB7WQ57_DIOAL|nr:hypothetical protein IHE45_02G043800 [Dioscorea alata]